MTTDEPRLRVVVVYGTRPEVIKLAPVVRALQGRPDRFDTVVCTTAQHRDLIDQFQAQLGVVADLDLDLMRPDQTLNSLAARVLAAVDDVVEDRRPDWLVVQGDTTTAMAAGLAAFHRGVRVAHVEAGLRTGDLAHPFPEEANRRMLDVLAAALFAPTPRSGAALVAEGHDPQRVHVVGNTVVDALQSMVGAAGDSVSPARVDEVLVTLHRRESFGDPLERMLCAIAELARRFPSHRFVFPVHPNPQVRAPAREVLGGLPNVELVEPMDHAQLIEHLSRARLVLTDSGGIQEEAPTFATPVLVLRDTTERPEGVDAGVARLVGADGDRLLEVGSSLLADPAALAAMGVVGNPYGDGQASARIVAVLAGEPWAPFRPAASVGRR